MFSQQEIIANLNKALDKIYELEDLIDKLEKEKTIAILEAN